MRNAIIIVILLLTSACSLGASESDSEQPTEVVVINTPLATSTARPTATALPVDDDEDEDEDDDDGGSSCNIRTDWFTYTVVGGDTIGNIAQRASTTSQNLVIGNCLDNPNLIVPGQRLYVPNVPIAATAIPQPTATSVPGPALPITIDPVKRIEAGWHVLPANSSVRLTWTSFPATTSEVRFYTVPTGTGTWECCRVLIGSDSTVSTGSASIFWQTPQGGPLGHLVAEALNSSGSSLLMSQTINAYVEAEVLIQGSVEVTQVIEGEARSVFLLRGATATLGYFNAPASTARVRFFYRSSSNQTQQIGYDDNPQDGFNAQWLIPPNLEGTLIGEAYNASDDLIARTGENIPLGVASGPAPGQGCRLTVNSALNYYGQANTTDQAAVGSLNAGDQIETLALSPLGWWGFDPDDSSGSNGVESLVWLSPDADVTEGQNCP